MAGAAGARHLFRDAETFDALEDRIIPRLFEGKEPSDQVRVWSAGCATGEEAYSLAILLAERAGHAEEVAKITAAAMRGEMDYAEALRQRPCRA